MRQDCVQVPMVITGWCRARVRFKTLICRMPLEQWPQLLVWFWFWFWACLALRALATNAHLGLGLGPGPSLGAGSNTGGGDARDGGREVDGEAPVAAAQASPRCIVERSGEWHCLEVQLVTKAAASAAAITDAAAATAGGVAAAGGRREIGEIWRCEIWHGEIGDVEHRDAAVDCVVEAHLASTQLGT